MNIYDSSNNAAGGNGSGFELNPILEHVMECDVCMAVVASLQSPTSLCEARCPEYRALLTSEHSNSHFHNDSSAFLSAF
jgi:hypothetical protein